MFFQTAGGRRTLLSTRLVLREPRLSDADDIFVCCSDSAVARYSNWYPHTDRRQSRQYISWLKGLARASAAGSYTWFVECKADRHVMGTVSLVELDDSGQIATIGYTFSPAYQGRGYATEAVYALLDYLFREQGVSRVQAKVMLENMPSIRLLERVGMHREGLLRQGAFCKTRCVDVYLYAILSREYNGLTGKTTDSRTSAYLPR